MTTGVLDRKDLAILKILKVNSRTPIREIALKTGIKQSTVHQRINKLVKKKVIQQFSIKTNDKLVGEELIIFLYIAAPNLPLKEIKKLKQVKEIYEIAGEYNYLLKIKVKDISGYNSLLKNIKKGYEITRLFSTITTQKLKED